MIQASPSPPSVNWRSVVVYYSLACLFSWPFFWWRDIHRESFLATIPPQLRNVLVMAGPGLAALICIGVFRRSHVRRITLFGGHPVRSVCFYVLPWVGLVIVSPSMAGKASQVTLDTAMWVQMLFFGFLATFGEELGWRGFLQDALRPIRPLYRYAIIGVMWELWHFTTRMRGHLPAVIIRVTLFSIAVTAMSALIGKATERTRSVLVAVTLHAWINISFEFFSAKTLVLLAASAAFWVLMIRKWPLNATPITSSAG
jgi:membrane protease YdiL (CAAX protease family)